MRPYGFLCVLLRPYASLWVLISPHASLLVPMGLKVYFYVFMRIYGF